MDAGAGLFEQGWRRFDAAFSYHPLPLEVLRWQCWCVFFAGAPRTRRKHECGSIKSSKSNKHDKHNNNNSKNDSNTKNNNKNCRCCCCY